MITVLIATTLLPADTAATEGQVPCWDANRLPSRLHHPPILFPDTTWPLSHSPFFATVPVCIRYGGHTSFERLTLVRLRAALCLAMSALLCDLEEEEGGSEGEERM